MIKIQKLDMNLNFYHMKITEIKKLHLKLLLLKSHQDGKLLIGLQANLDQLQKNSLIKYKTNVYKETKILNKH